MIPHPIQWKKRTMIMTVVTTTILKKRCQTIRMMMDIMVTVDIMNMVNVIEVIIIVTEDMKGKSHLTNDESYYLFGDHLGELSHTLVLDYLISLFFSNHLGKETSSCGIGCAVDIRKILAEIFLSTSLKLKFII